MCLFLSVSLSLISHSLYLFFLDTVHWLEVRTVRRGGCLPRVPHHGVPQDEQGLLPQDLPQGKQIRLTIYVGAAIRVSRGFLRKCHVSQIIPYVPGI